MHRHKKPLAVIVAEEIKQKIDTNVYRSAEQLPAEVDLAREMGVSRATLRESLSMLERQGLVIRRHGVGSFVAEPDRQIIASFDKLDSMIDLIRRSGYEATMTLVDSCREPLDDEACETLHLAPGAVGYRFNTMYSANTIPLVYTYEFVAGASLPDPLTAPRGDCEDLADFITRNTGKPPVANLTQLKGILPTQELMRILMIDANSPIIRQRFTLFDKEKRPVGWGYDFFNSSWFEFSIYMNTTRL